MDMNEVTQFFVYIITNEDKHMYIVVHVRVPPEYFQRSRHPLLNNIIRANTRHKSIFCFFQEQAPVLGIWIP